MDSQRMPLDIHPVEFVTGLPSQVMPQGRQQSLGLSAVCMPERNRGQDEMVRGFLGVRSSSGLVNVSAESHR